MSIETVLYRAKATATGGRDGRANSSDNILDVKLTTPKELGGAGGDGTNPEQLFAAGYSACFIGAMKFVAAQQKLQLPADTRLPARSASARFPPALASRSNWRISIPGMPRDDAEALVHKAHTVCPYSNATRNNIDVKLTVV